MFLLYLITSFAELIINKNEMPAELKFVWILVTLSVSAIVYVLESNKNNKGE